MKTTCYIHQFGLITQQLKINKCIYTTIKTVTLKNIDNQKNFSLILDTFLSILLFTAIIIQTRSILTTLFTYNFIYYYALNS